MLMGAIVVTIVVAGVLVYWFLFRWEATPKPWCVLLYLTSNTPASVAPVSRPNAETGVPSNAPAAATLDQKLDQVLGVIRSLPCATDAGIAAKPEWNNVYVAYRAVWDDPLKDPEARVVRPGLSAPSAKYFPGETVFDVGYAIDFTKDITKFFEWAYDNCPATHYAVFFWGHAMGPAGFFQPSETPVVVSPLKELLMKAVFFLTGADWSGNIDLAKVSEALGSIVQEQYKKNPTPPPDPEGKARSAGGQPLPVNTGSSGNPGDPSTQVVFQAGEAVPKVDVVLFQDCWMSTLETAFELQDDVQYIVSSQSLVPAGFDEARQVGAVWPYEKLISTFLKPPADFTAPMMEVLRCFFEGDGRPAGKPQDYNRYPAKKVLFSLMDCGTTAGFVSASMKAEYRALVQALYSLEPEGRSILIEQAVQNSGRLFEMSGVDLKVGDQALIDVLTLCAYLADNNAWPALPATVTQQDKDAISAAAAALRLRVRALVKTTFQSPPPVPGDLAYAGVAALYEPYVIVGTDPYIMSAFRSSYAKFQFAKDTLVTPAPGGGATECSWAQYAFDRYPRF